MMKIMAQCQSGSFNDMATVLITASTTLNSGAIEF
jgi:hypothetical protein